jgi:superoxide reductase
MFVSPDKLAVGRMQLQSEKKNCQLTNANCQLYSTLSKPFKMPRVFKALEIEKEGKEIKRDYLDRHMPHVFCPDEVKRGEKFEVKVKLGKDYPHPDDYDHYISVIQLWNRETLLAEARYSAGVYGNKSSHSEIDFFIVAPEVSMNLSAMAVCTKHGLWQSEEKHVKVI